MSKIGTFREYLAEAKLKEVNESSDVYDSEYKSDLILKLNKSAKLGDNLMYDDEKYNKDMFIVGKDSSGLTMFNIESGTLTSFTKGKKVDIYFDAKTLKKLI